MLLLGNEITDTDEETFLLFSQTIPSQNLGFVDAEAKDLDLTVSGRDVTIAQSPGLLSSDRRGGMTGAVVWKITPLFADWIASDDSVLFKTSIFDRDSQVLELGCGVSGIVAVVLAPRIGRYIATDQEYVFKLLKQNVVGNAPKRKVSGKAKPRGCLITKSNIEVIALDWESDSVSNVSMLGGKSINGGPVKAVDAIIACDCIYNEALIDPFVRTCGEVSESSKEFCPEKPTVCIIAQQLRSDTVFAAWLAAFHKVFHVWRVPDASLIPGLRQGSGFVVHIGVLRNGGT